LAENQPSPFIVGRLHDPSREEEHLAVKDRLDFLAKHAVLHILCPIARVPIKVIRIGDKFA
jgi:hypothetical protein